MKPGLHNIDLGRLALSPGDGRRLDLEVVPGGLELGGQRYEVAGRKVVARVDVSRTAAGYALRLRFQPHVDGPCMRCLEPAHVQVGVDAREVEQHGARDEELQSPYVSEEELDLGAWAHDALVLALPTKLLCREDCRGLCAVCGVSLNDADPADHRHEAPRDPRFAKLRELLK